MLRFKEFIPWWVKIAIKILLNRLPFSRTLWSYKLGLLKHGDMLNPEYSWKVFNSHYSKTCSYLPDRFVVCELGPGDSLATAMIAPCYGAIQSYLIDVDNFSSSSIYPYGMLADYLTAKNLNCFDYSAVYLQDELLEKNNSCYLTDGLNSLKSIPGGKINFLFSQAVLEHIRLDIFCDVIQETYRVLEPGGIASHKIDLKDHLGGGLNNLRFPRIIWESNLFASSGFYTNRLRVSEIINILKKTGFKIIDLNETRWISSPLARHRLSCEFSNFSENDLRVSGIDIVLQK